MVASPYFPSDNVENQLLNSSDFKWTTVNLQEVFETNYRLEAAVYGIEGRQARQDVAQCKWGVVYLSGEGGLATVYHRPRFKRIYVEKSAFPIYQPAQINELYPKPSAYISGLTQTDIDALRVEKGQILLTCSGTIGNCTYVRNSLDNLIFSHDVIRIEPKEYNGFIYAFLKSKTGFFIINTNNYGAVVKHIEPKHLNAVPIPNPPPIGSKNRLETFSNKFRGTTGGLCELRYKNSELPPVTASESFSASNISSNTTSTFRKKADVVYSQRAFS